MREYARRFSRVADKRPRNETIFANSLHSTPRYNVPTFPHKESEVVALAQMVADGLPAAYEIQRQATPGGTWDEAGTSATTEHSVMNQPRNVPLSFRVIAVNRTGSGAPSGVVSVLL